VLTLGPAAATSDLDPPRRRPEVLIDIRETTVRLAMAYVVAEAGWTPAAHPAPGVVRVSDRIPHRSSDEPPLDVLVLVPTPNACRRALDAFSAGDVRAVVLSTNPPDLPTTLELVGGGLGVLPMSVIDAALRWPSLRPRLEQTLRLVLRGSTNATIAKATHQSEATVKRDVAELLRLFDAPNRLALATTVTRLGYAPGST